MDAFYPGATQQVKSVGNPVKFMIHDSSDAGLDYQFGTFHAWRRSYVKRRAVRRIVAPGDFSYRVCLGMENIRLGETRFILADILEAGGCAVEPVRYYHRVLDNYGSDFPTLAIGIFRPDSGHSEIASVYCLLLWGLFHFSL